MIIEYSSQPSFPCLWIFKVRFCSWTFLLQNCLPYLPLQPLLPSSTFYSNANRKKNESNCLPTWDSLFSDLVMDIEILLGLGLYGFTMAFYGTSWLLELFDHGAAVYQKRLSFIISFWYCAWMLLSNQYALSYLQK